MQTTSNLNHFFKQRVGPILKRIEESKWFSRFGKRTWWIVAVATIAVAAGSIGFLQANASTAETAATETLQTTVARRSDLVIYASGTGTLIALDEVDLGFGTSGQVDAINVEVGDEVNQGDVLATINETSVKIQYTQARRSYLELTSVSSVAEAEEAEAAAQTDVTSATSTLSYLISPEVYYWETVVESAELELEAAKTAAEAAPGDTELQEKLTKAEQYLDYVEDKLTGNWYYYEHQYLKDNFTVFDRSSGTKYIAAPSDAEIAEARAALTKAEATLQEAQYLYAALTGGEVPEDATGSGLSELEQAKLDLESAENDLEGTKLITPIDGTVMSLDMSIGDTVGTSSVATVADLSKPYLEVFLDESDWANISVGYPVEVIFDILPDNTYTGVVTQVDPGLYSENGTSAVRAIVQLTNIDPEDFNLPLGTSAAVDVIGGEATDAILIPIEALHDAGNGQYAVFILENGEPRLQLVEIGIQDLTYVEIKSGLNPGDVVTTGIAETQ
jgi:RND family efflux transporter MFP subunit